MRIQLYVASGSITTLCFLKGLKRDGYANETLWRRPCVWSTDMKNLPKYAFFSTLHLRSGTSSKLIKKNCFSPSLNFWSSNWRHTQRRTWLPRLLILISLLERIKSPRLCTLMISGRQCYAVNGFSMSASSNTCLLRVFGRPSVAVCRAYWKAIRLCRWKRSSGMRTCFFNSM